MRLAMEVFARLVAAAVFKTAGRQDKLVFGGFDSHTLPPFSRAMTVTPQPIESMDYIQLAGECPYVWGPTPFFNDDHAS